MTSVLIANKNGWAGLSSTPRRLWGGKVDPCVYLRDSSCE